jgi:hypothetical protein
MAATIRFTLEGPENSGGTVFFADFRALMNDIAKCLKLVELRTERGARVRHEVSDLKYASATIELTAVSPRREPEVGKRVYDTFKQVVKGLERGENVDPRFRREDLEAFRDLARPVTRKAKLMVGGVRVTTQFVANIDRLLLETFRSRGTVKGRVEKLNLHNRHEFTLFTPIGDVAIPCHFEEELFPQVRQAIRQNVTVTGLLSFTDDGSYPSRVDVEEIEIHPPDEQLPTLRSLYGAMPGAAGGKSAAEFVKGLRDE